MLTKENFDALKTIRDDYCVSIYIPTYRAGHNQEDRLRFKNALKEARDGLIEMGLEEKQARGFLTTAYDLLYNERFWLHLSDGLVVFIRPGQFEYHILPLNFNPFVFVGQQFYLRPLLPLLQGKNRFFLLALSQNQVRFFEADRYSITPVIIGDLVPGDLQEALQFKNRSINIQSHSGNSRQGASIVHGHGMGKDHKVKDLIYYCRSIDNGIMEMLHDEKAPLMLASVDYLAPIYREVTNYPHVTDLHINGNPDGEDPVLLHEKAWALMGDFFNQKPEKLKAFEAALAYGKASFNLHEILTAAVNGRVKTLFLNKDYRNWGQLDEAANQIFYHRTKEPHSQDLLELAALHTYDNGGEVLQMSRKELPRMTANANAVFRY